MKQILRTKARCCSSTTSDAAKTSSGFSLFFASVLMILLLQGALVNSVFGQGGIAVHTTDIRANFGIDADLYARRLMFPPLYPAASCNGAPTLGSLSNIALLDSATSDDWFSPNPGGPTGGVGIIDTAGMAAFRSKLIGCGSDPVCKNAMFFSRMAYPNFTVVPYATGVNVFLDAVAVRDHNAIAAAIDSSAFCATSDKNIHDPRSWCLGVAGTPAKNDIVDVAAHIRQNVVNATSPLDTGLWGYAYATTMTTNGDSHLDFELIRCIDYSGAAIGANEYLSHPAGNINSAVMFCGPDSGHTAGHHSTVTGEAVQPGDVLMTVDYSCGGKKTDIALYVWVDPAHVGPDGTTPFSTTQYNQIPTRLFDFCTNSNDPAVDPLGGGADFFINSAGVAPFGYNRIRPKTNDTIFWARVNVYRTSAGSATLDTTLGPPYTSMISGSIQNNLEQLQEVEIALNFTKAGLAIPPSQGPCQQIFGNLMVKTRSSTSVTSELKDYVGPVQFGAFTNILLEASGGTLDCDHPSITLCAHATATQPGGITYCWQGPNSATGACLPTVNPGVNDSCVVVTQPGTYYISASLDGGCTTLDSVVVLDSTDVTPPTITCAANTTIECPATPNWPPPTASDNVDQSVDISLVGETTIGSCPTVYTRTYRATDDCGNTATCSRSVSVDDNTAPTITCPANTTIDCPAVVSFGNATANDACDASVDIAIVSTIPSGTCPVVYTRTFRATDDCGNTATCSATITVRDITAPSITCPVNTTIDCPAVVTFGNATASDACDQSVDVTIISTTASGSCPVVHTRIYRATDDCGNTSTCSATVTVRDITAPSITCPANTTIDCPAVLTFGNATASDACDASVDVTIVSTVPSGTCPVVHTRTWRATDDCGNTSTCSATITVRDITAPSITCPANTTIDCPAVVTFGNATASDACDASVDVTIVGTVPSGTCPVVHTRTWRATDDCGNTSTCSATITVRDIVAPSITCPSNQTIDCPAVVIWGNATASDACDASVDVTIVSTVPSGTCPVVHTRTWRATDDCGNTSTCSATITVRDIAAPSITCPANTTIDCPAVVIFGNATASDACDASVDVTIVSTVPSGSCPVVHTRTWRATDDCGNTATCSATITVRDITAPSITCPANTTIDCPAVVIFGNATASDACDQSVDVTIISTTASGSCPVVHTRIYRATDDCGNTSTCSATITVRDITAPSITCPVNTTIDCPAVVIWGNATASDACDASVDVTIVSTVPSGTCPVVHTRTWRATDDCGNTSTCSATITVRDITAPSITCPVNTTIDCPAVVIWGNATASDACDASVDVTIVSTVPSGTCPVVHTRTWRATDDCGNTSTCSATVTVRDITAPSITCPSNQTIDCPAVVIWGNATASDACDASVDVTIVSTVPSGTCPVVHTRTWRATDDCGNTSTCSTTITVRDIAAPSITCPANTTIDCPAVVIFGNATASDACDQSVDVTIVSTVPSGTCPVVHTRTWRATDDCGNTATCSATITVRDITAPSITCPANTTIDCPAVVTFGNATASDACDASVDVTIVSTVPSGTCPVVHTRTWRATDDCGNTSTCSATITVRDITAPSITCPSNQTIDCPAVVTFGTATASDACDGSVDVTIVSTVPSGSCPVVHTRTWRATDDCGNTSTCSATISVRDITAPSITCPSNQTIDCPAVVIWGNATASDACDQSVDVTIVSTVPSGSCPVVHTRTWRATDDCGNTSTCSATITVRDITAPSITCPSNQTIDCPAVVTFGNATASDACDQSVDVTIISTTASGSCPVVHTRIYKATDDCGNTSTCSATITVRDITAPSITCPSNQTIDCPAVVIWGNATASDACDQSVDVTIISTTASGSCPVVHTRIYKATDDCGNTSTCSATITVRDITAPSITCPVNTTIDCPAVVTFGNATASDACDQSVDVTIVSTTASGSCPVVHTRTWLATDDCGNTSTCSATITVRDITAPSITCPVNTTIDCPAVVTFGNATASDACDQSVDVTIVSTTASGSCPVVHTRTWLATDDCGNTSTCSATITVRDITAPSITCPANTTIDCPAVVTFGNATASDACDQSVDVTIVSTTASGSCPVVHTRIYKATDDCGNTSTCSATITVRDITAPSITCPANTTIDCPAVVTFGNATASDACDQSVDVTIVSTTASGSCPVVHTRIYKATDDCGNTSTCSATITVRDITAPSITCPVNTTIDCPAVVTFGNATASDACDQSVDVTIVSTTASGSCPVIHTRIYKATDDCGNTSTCSATITVRDITAPSITCPSNQTIDCPAVVTFGNATASDACDGSVDVTIVSTTASGSCPVVHTRIYKATDDCGNTSTCSATITVRDITAPSITCPVNTTIDCPAVVTFGNATASDACDQSVEVIIVSTTASGSCPVVHTRTWLATDDCGNTSTCSATISVRDITPPSITCAANATINCPATPTWPAVTASDACDQEVAITFGETTTNVSCGTYSVTRIYLATDDCGNTSTCSRTVSVANVPASCSLAAPATRPICGSTGNTLCANSSNAVSYEWKIIVDAAPYTGAGWVITAGANTNCITYTAGSGDSVHVRLIVTNACGCQDSCDVLFGCKPDYWGCTLGFWKNHTSIWNDASDPIAACVANGISSFGSPYSGNGTSGSSFMTTFGLTPAQMTAAGYPVNLTLLQALNLGGGTYELLARSGIAALLNTCGLSGHFYYGSPATIITMVHNAVVAGSASGANTVGNIFQSHNEQQPDNCPEGGSANHDVKKRVNLFRNAFGATLTNDEIAISAYPNPFNSTATIEFQLTNTSNVSVEIYDLNGKKVADLFKGTVDAGLSYQVQLNGGDLAAGIYVYRINTGEHIYNDRLILIK